jgi:anti-sigma factor (TIGR02949 family)
MDVNPSTPSERLDCKQVVEFLVDYLEGDMSNDLRAQFDAHLKSCTACVEYLDSYEKTVALAKRSFDAPEEVVEEMPDELVEAILSTRRDNRTS